MNYYLIVNLSDKEKDELAEKIAPIQKKFSMYDWLAKDFYHIHLYTFPKVKEIDPLEAFLDNATFDLSAQELKLLSGGVFIHHALTFYVDFYREKKLRKLVKKIDQAMDHERAGHYIPYITVGKSKIPSKQQYFHVKKHLEAFAPDFSVNVNQIQLIQKHEQSDTVVWEMQKTFELYDEEG